MSDDSDGSSVVDMETLMAPTIDQQASNTNNIDTEVHRKNGTPTFKGPEMDAEFLKTLEGSESSDGDESTGLLAKQYPTNPRNVDQLKESRSPTKNPQRAARPPVKSTTSSTSNTISSRNNQSLKRPLSLDDASSIRLQFGSSMLGYRAIKKGKSSIKDNERIVIVKSSAENDDLTGEDFKKSELEVDYRQNAKLTIQEREDDNTRGASIYTGQVQKASHSPFVDCVAIWNESKQCYILELVTHVVSGLHGAETSSSDQVKQEMPPARTRRATKKNKTR